MSAVSVAVVFGFVCCALAVRVLGVWNERARRQPVRVRSVRRGSRGA